MHLAQINGITNPSTIFPDNPDSFAGLFTSRVLLFAIAGAGFVFLVMVISAGYKYMTSLGEPAAIQGATKQLVNSLTGLLLVITTFFIIQIIQTIFGLNII